jgi:hypothetical protein
MTRTCLSSIEQSFTVRAADSPSGQGYTPFEARS